MLANPMSESPQPGTDWWASARTVEGGVLVGLKKGFECIA